MSETNNESDALLQGTIDALNGRIAILDNRGNIIRTNKAWRSFAGHISPNNQSSGTDSNYLRALSSNRSDSPEIAASYDIEIARGISEIISGKRDSFELEYACRIENAQQWIFMRAVKLGDGEALRVIVNYENKTAGKLTEQALHESEESYRILAETASDVIIKINSSGTILFINRACEKVFGYKQVEMTGRPLMMIIPEHSRDKYLNCFDQYLENGTRDFDRKGIEIPAQHRDGRIFPLEISFDELEQSGRHYFIAIARDISERRETRQMTAHLAAIVESSEDAIISKDLQGIITSWNKAAEKIYGYTAQEIIGKPGTVLIPPYLAGEEPLILRRIKNGEQIDHYETLRRRKDGRDINISLTVSPIKDENGKITGASKIARDISERRQSDRSLMENQVMLSLAMQSSRMGAWEQDIATDVVNWSEELEEIFGLKKGEFEQTKSAYYSFVHEDDRQRIRQEVEKAIAEHREYSIEFRFYHASGSIRWMEGRGMAVYSDKGAPVRLYGIGIDITDRKRVEEARRESEERFRYLANAAPVLIWVSAPNGKHVWFNKPWLNFTGRTIKQEFGDGWTEGIYPGDLERCLETYTVSFESQTSFSMEYRLRRHDGEYRWIIDNGVPSFAPGGEFEGFIGSCMDITERKQAETVAERYRLLSSKARDVIFFLQTDGKIVEANQAAVETYGYDHAALLQMNLRDLRSPETLPLVENQLAEAKTSGIQFETNHVRRDGTIFPVEVSATGAEVGGERLLISIVRDITDRQKAEQAIRQSAKQLALVADIAPVFLARCDREERYKFVNKSYARRFGLEPRDCVGRQISEVVGEEAYKKFHQNVAAVLSGTPVEFNIEVSYSKIGRHFLHCSYAPEFDADGEVIGWVAAVTDISENKRTQERLIAAERKAAEDYQGLLQRIVPLGQILGSARDLITVYRAIFEFARTSMPCSAFFVSFYDAEKRERTAAFAWGEGEEIDISQLPPMTISPSGGSNSQAILQKKTVITDRYWDTMKNRPHVVLQENGIDPMSSLVVPMMLKNEVIGTLEVQAHENEAFSREHAITLEMVANLSAVAIENVRLLEVEAGARHVAEEANRAKDEFLSVLSHELRTPLNAIFGWTRMLKSGALDVRLKDQAIETIERNARLQNNLIEDLLDVSRIVSGKMRLECSKVNFVSIVENCVETSRPLAADKEIELVFHTQTPSLEVYGDTTRLQQVINNLLSNAIKFTLPGGRVSVNSTGRNEKARLQITDTGIGISKDFLPFIFDRFKQADSTTRRAHSGLGLGMTIVRHLTNLHGGQIEVSSEGENRGSTFVIELPLAGSETETGLTANDNARDLAAKLKGAKILLVDDDLDGLQPLQILLESQKAEVYCAFSAHEALQKITNEANFDLLVSDIGMPEMDGYELITEVRKLPDQNKHFLPAIALTAYASAQDRKRALSCGYQMHLSKPVDFEQFLKTVYNLLNDPNEE